MKQASDCICSTAKCKSQAVAFWPVVDPDIPSYPYCRKHLDEAKLRVLMQLSEIDKKFKKNG